MTLEEVLKQIRQEKENTLIVLTAAADDLSLADEMFASGRLAGLEFAEKLVAGILPNPTEGNVI